MREGLGAFLMFRFTASTDHIRLSGALRKHFLLDKAMKKG
jgi:hypothetical protein